MLPSFAIKYYPLIQSPIERHVHSATLIQNKWRSYKFLKFLKNILKSPYYKNEAAISGAVHNIARRR